MEGGAPPSAGEPASGLHILQTHYVGRDVQSWVKPLLLHRHHHGLWKTETQSRPTQEGLRAGGGGGVDGSGSRAGGLEGLIKTVVIHSVLQWFMSVVGTNLAHGLWKSVEQQQCWLVTTEIMFACVKYNAPFSSCTITNITCKSLFPDYISKQVIC